jgi:hypothetical protein
MLNVRDLLVHTAAKLEALHTRIQDAKDRFLEQQRLVSPPDISPLDITLWTMAMSYRSWPMFRKGAALAAPLTARSLVVGNFKRGLEMRLE